MSKGGAMKRISALVLIVVMACIFSSCVSIRNDASVSNFLDETVLRELSVNDPSVEGAVKILRMITSDQTELKEFSDPRTASAEYRDVILAYMMNTGYSKYTGNTSKIMEAEKKYPKLRISLLIPEEDFEYTVYSNFGGAKSVIHKSGTVFTYLSKVGGYTSVGSVTQSNTEIEICTVEETSNTYIITFYARNDSGYSSLYSGVFVKRTDGSMYLGKLTRVADPKIRVPQMQ